MKKKSVKKPSAKSLKKSPPKTTKKTVKKKSSRQSVSSSKSQTPSQKKSKDKGTKRGRIGSTSTGPTMKRISDLQEESKPEGICYVERAGRHMTISEAIAWGKANPPPADATSSLSSAVSTSGATDRPMTTEEYDRRDTERARS